MANLKCIVEKCSYNQDHLCSRGDIQVGGKHASKMEETNCESYSPGKHGGCINSISHPAKMTGIDCEAQKCMYNEGYKCVATNVDIKGCSKCGCHDTECATFTTK